MLLDMLCRITSILVFVRNFSRKICETTLKIRYRKGSPVKFFEVSYYQKNFQLSTIHKSEDRGGMKMLYDFFFTCDSCLRFLLAILACDSCLRFLLAIFACNSCLQSWLALMACKNWDEKWKIKILKKII